MIIMSKVMLRNCLIIKLFKINLTINQENFARSFDKLLMSFFMKLKKFDVFIYNNNFKLKH